ncbi:hypothetical protein [Leifsonia sp. NPDC080035]|uniref:ATPase n=1 Tax=Leifsonia sp. NPDC080035 TaxID=3143936 RepID=A0AAU7GG73_9MICO
MSDDKEQPIPDWQMDPDIVPETLPVPETHEGDDDTDGEDGDRR